LPIDFDSQGCRKNKKIRPCWAVQHHSQSIMHYIAHTFDSFPEIPDLVVAELVVTQCRNTRLPSTKRIKLSYR
jgi:hypothetical protein